MDSENDNGENEAPEKDLKELSSRLFSNLADAGFAVWLIVEVVMRWGWTWTSVAVMASWELCRFIVTGAMYGSIALEDPESLPRKIEESAPVRRVWLAVLSGLYILAVVLWR